MSSSLCFFVFLELLAFLLFARSIISDGVPSSSINVVTHLPGFDGPLPFYFETGYVSADELDDIQLFYYFFKSESNPHEDPLLLWFTGGPGCSSISSIFFEIGPVKIRPLEYNGSLPTLQSFSLAWSKFSNVLYVDSPVGTGFSYSRLSEFYEDGDSTWPKYVYTFIRKWFLQHPQFLSNPFYIGGDSYAGKVVPTIGFHIAEGIEAGLQPTLNFKGYLVGNPWTGEKIDDMTRIPHARNLGIISDEIYESTYPFCKGDDFENPANSLCATKIEVVKEFLSEIYTGFYLERACAGIVSPKPKSLMQEDRRDLKEKLGEPVPPEAPPVNCRSYAYYLSYFWANNDLVRRALHIREGTVPDWRRCSLYLHYVRNVSSIQYHYAVTSKGYRALIYSGDHDLVVPHIGTQAWIRSLNYSIVEDWRSWSYDGQVAGYTRTYANNLTFATVLGSGHTTPEFSPQQSFALVKRWISQEPI